MAWERHNWKNANFNPYKRDDYLLHAEVVSRRQHKGPKTQVDPLAEKEEVVSVDLGEVLNKSAEGKLRWLQKASLQAGVGKVKVNKLYDIVAHPRFAKGVSSEEGRQMGALLASNLHLFSLKQRRFILSDANPLPTPAEAGVLVERLNSGARGAPAAGESPPGDRSASRSRSSSPDSPAAPPAAAASAAALPPAAAAPPLPLPAALAAAAAPPQPQPPPAVAPATLPPLASALGLRKALEEAAAAWAPTMPAAPAAAAPAVASLGLAASWSPVVAAPLPITLAAAASGAAVGWSAPSALGLSSPPPLPAAWASAPLGGASLPAVPSPALPAAAVPKGARPKALPPAALPTAPPSAAPVPPPVEVRPSAVAVAPVAAPPAPVPVEAPATAVASAVAKAVVKAAKAGASSTGPRGAKTAAAGLVMNALANFSNAAVAARAAAQFATSAPSQPGPTKPSRPAAKAGAADYFTPAGDLGASPGGRASRSRSRPCAGDRHSPTADAAEASAAASARRDRAAVEAGDASPQRGKRGRSSRSRKRRKRRGRSSSSGSRDRGRSRKRARKDGRASHSRSGRRARTVFTADAVLPPVPAPAPAPAAPVLRGPGTGAAAERSNRWNVAGGGTAAQRNSAPTGPALPIVPQLLPTGVSPGCDLSKLQAAQLAAARRLQVVPVTASAVRPGDWFCPICAAHNYASKFQCFRCIKGTNPLLDGSGGSTQSMPPFTMGGPGGPGGGFTGWARST